MAIERTDIHRPSAINPADYEWVSFEYVHVSPGDIGSCMYLQHCREVIRAHMAKTGGTYASHEHGGNCMVCGAHCLYTVLFYHAATNTYVRTGQECAEKLDRAKHTGDWDAFRAAVRDARELQTGKRKAQATLGDKGLSAAWDIYTADFASFGPKMPYEEGTIRDIVGKLVKWGSVSEKSLNYIGVLLGKIGNRGNIEARRAVEKAAAADCPSGRVQITGKVISIKTEDSPYGEQAKMLVVADSGFRVYGTMPAKATQDRGDTITFVATVTPSRDDSKFGFFSRPMLVTPKESAQENESCALANASNQV